MVKEAVDYIYERTDYKRSTIEDIITKLGKFLVMKFKEDKPFIWRGVMSLRKYKKDGYSFDINTKNGVKTINVKGGVQNKLKVSDRYRFVE